MNFSTISQVEQVVGDIRCAILDRGFSFRVSSKHLAEGEVGIEGKSVFVQAEMWRKDHDTGEYGSGRTRKYYVSPFMSEGELVRTLLVSCLAYAEHEIREGFKYRDQTIYGPHIGLDGLLDAMNYPEDKRPHPHDTP